ncbi:hypothetical protein AAMO2058_000670600 [Amorphochlora amoebiformis]
MTATYRYYNEFTSESFDNFAYTILVCTLCILGVGTYAHIYAIFFTKERQNLLESVKKMNRDTLMYFSFNVLVTGSVGIAYVFLDPDTSLLVCNWMYRAGLVVVYVGNFLLYRLLLSKSTLYDPMFRMRRLTTFTWYLVNVVYLPVILYGLAATVIWSRYINILNMYHTKITPAVFLAFDTVISMNCMVILAAPPFLAPSDKNIRLVVARNCTSMLVAVGSTFLLLLYALSASGNSREPFFLVTVILKLGSIDATVNFTAVLFSWPLGFYWKVFADNCQRAGMAATVILTLGGSRNPISQGMQSKGNSKGNNSYGKTPSPRRCNRDANMRMSILPRKGTRMSLAVRDTLGVDSLKLARESGVDYFAKNKDTATGIPTQQSSNGSNLEAKIPLRGRTESLSMARVATSATASSADLKRSSAGQDGSTVKSESRQTQATAAFGPENKRVTIAIDFGVKSESRSSRSGAGGFSPKMLQRHDSRDSKLMHISRHTTEPHSSLKTSGSRHPTSNLRTSTNMQVTSSNTTANTPAIGSPNISSVQIPASIGNPSPLKTVNLLRDTSPGLDSPLSHGS